MKQINIKEFIGKTFTKINVGNNYIEFTTINNELYKMKHTQDCCEEVYIESIVGNINNLIGLPILKADEIINEGRVTAEEVINLNRDSSTYTWTFYKLATIKGYVDIRWYGESNGYYSEEIEIYQIKNDLTKLKGNNNEQHK